MVILGLDKLLESVAVNDPRLVGVMGGGDLNVAADWVVEDGPVEREGFNSFGLVEDVDGG